MRRNIEYKNIEDSIVFYILQKIKKITNSSIFYITERLRERKSMS